MKREFIYNLILLIAINAVVKPAYIFGIDRTVQNLVGVKAYGAYSSLLAFTFLLQIVNDFGVQNYNSRHISRHRGLLEKYVSNILVLKALLAGVYLALIFIAAIILKYDRSVYPMIALLAVNQILTSLIFYLRSNISGLGFYRIDSLFSSMDRLALLAVCGGLLSVASIRAHFQIEWFVYAQTFTLALTELAAFAFVYNKVKWLRFRFSKPFLIHLLKESAPFALAIFLMTLYTKIDIVMIERMLPDGKEQAGIYASAYRLLDAVNMIGFLFAGLLLPMFSKMLKEKTRVEGLLRLSFQLMFALSTTIASAVFFYSNQIMRLLYREANDYSGDVLRYLMISFVAVSATYIYGALLNATGSLRKMNRMFLLAIGINVGLNIWLIPSQKAAGATVATAVTQFFIAGAQMILAYRELKLKIDARQVFRLVGYVLTLLVFQYVVSLNWTRAYWQKGFFICLALSGLLALAFGLFRRSALTAYLTQETVSEPAAIEEFTL